jgi:hypothetical protein
VIVWLFAAIVILSAAAFLVIEAMDKAESIQKRVPWIPKILKRRDAFLALLLICFVLLVGDGYELLTKEVPEVPTPPIVTFNPPSGPRLTINQLPRPIKDRCWAYSYGYLGNPVAGLTTLYCNATYDAPFLLTIEYDQKLTKAEPVMLPMKGGIAQYEEAVRDNQVTVAFDYPGIRPNIPLSIVVYGDGKNTPAIEKIALNTKKGLRPDFSY